MAGIKPPAIKPVKAIKAPKVKAIKSPKIKPIKEPKLPKNSKI